MAWLKEINDDELNKLTYATIRAQKRGVCFKHFTAEAVLVLKNGRRTLKGGFLPSLNLKCSTTDESCNTLEGLKEKPGKKEE